MTNLKIPSLILFALSAALLVQAYPPVTEPPPASAEVGSYMTIAIEAGGFECFFEDLKVKDRFEMWFEVTRGDPLDILYTLSGPQKQHVISRTASFGNKNDAEREKEGHVLFHTQVEGMHTICFANSGGSDTKTISFFLRDIQGCASQIPPINHAANDVAKVEHLGPLWDSALRLDRMLDELEHLQHYMRVREQVHRDTAESTNSRVAWLTALESTLLISMSIVQLMWIRQWFGERDIKRPTRV